MFIFGDSSISWRKNRSLLHFDGTEANLIKIEMCKQICEDGEDNSAGSHALVAGSSCIPNDFSEDIESLKLGQPSNGEAIRTLSENIAYLTSVMSQIQDNITGNACESELSKRKSLDINSNSNTANSNYAYSNEDKVNSILMGEQNNLNDNSIVIHEQINLNNNSIVMHENINLNYRNQSNTYQSISIAPDSPPARESISTDVGQSRRKDGSIDEQSRSPRTYAQVAKSPPPVNRINGKPSTDNNTENIMQVPAARKMNERIDDSDGFIGVKRKRNRIRKFFLSGIAENVNDQDILCYLEKRKVIPTYLSLFKSKRKGSISAKLHVQANVCPLIENETFWPKFVKCKPWKPTSTDGRNNSPPEGILSTYV